MNKKFESTSEYSKEVLKRFESMAGKYSKVEIFNDWLDWNTASMQAWCGKGYDAYYDVLVKCNTKYNVDELKQFDDIAKLVQEGVEKCEQDVLATVFMQVQPNKKLRQEFTPSCLCELMDVLTNNDENVKRAIAENGYCRVDEICCGSGGISIAKCKGLKSRGIDMDKVFFLASDIDKRCCQMAVLQFTYMGMKAKVIQQDVLLLKTYGEYETLQLAYSQMEEWEKIARIAMVGKIETEAREAVLKKKGA